MEALAGQMLWDLVAVMQISVLAVDNWIDGQWGFFLICGDSGKHSMWPFEDQIADGSKKQFVQTGVYKNRKNMEPDFAYWLKERAFEEQRS